MIKHKKSGILCKLHIEKVHDHINWNLRLQILKDMGFGSKWIRWIKYCISSVKFSLIINCNTVGFFQSQRDLKRADPMSPFQFSIAMEGLNHMAKEGKD